MSGFIDIFCRNYGIDAEDAEALIREMQPAEFRKGDSIVREGAFDDSFYILEDGIWSCTKPGASFSTVIWFAFGGEAVTNVVCYSMQQPSRVNIYSETDSKAYWISRNRLDSLCANSLAVANTVRRIFEKHSYRFETDVVWMAEKVNAKERYISIVNEHPELVKYVRLKKIASYLWVTPQSLSRIRANIDK